MQIGMHLSKLPDENLLHGDQDERDDEEAEGEVKQEGRDLRLGAVLLWIQPKVVVVTNLQMK